MGGMIRWILIAIKYIAPMVIKAVWFMIKLGATTVGAFWIGVPAVVNRMVRAWMEQAWASKIPTEYDSILRWIFVGVAYTLIFLWWIGVSYLTIFLLNLLFRK